ncbi:MAG: tetratricopeptide repeat protein [Patescibacteria group bacterium]
MNLRFEQRSLVEALNISQLKTDLEAIREKGNKVSISRKEREIADIIQQAVSNFPYKAGANNPSEMVANQYINCVGASVLGGALMKEAGLNYLVGDVPRHSILFLVTSDGRVEWRDMHHASFNEDLTDEEIVGRRKDGEPLTVADIVAFSQKSRSEGLMFDIDNSKYREKLSWVKEGQRQCVTVFEPEYGQQIQILNNIGSTLYNLGRPGEAVKAYRQAIDLDPKIAYPYNGLGSALDDLGRHKEAVEAYRQAIGIDPKYVHAYNGLGHALRSLGHNEEAIKAYEKFIESADKESDDAWIKRAEQIIAELKK